jgi:hypothetical protein
MMEDLKKPVNLTIKRGAAYGLEVTIHNEESDPVDLSGYSLKSQIRADWDKPLLAEFEVEIENATLGKVVLSLSAESTKKLPVSGAKYDVFLKNSDDVPACVMAGDIRVIPALTRDE